MLYHSTEAFLIFSLLVLIIIDRGVFKSEVIIVEPSVSPCSSIHFPLMYFATLLCTKARGLPCLLRDLTPLSLCNASFYPCALSEIRYLNYLLMLTWYIFPYLSLIPPVFDVNVGLLQTTHSFGCCFFIHFDSICLSVVFRPLTFFSGCVLYAAF